MERLGTNGYMDNGEFCDVGFGSGVGVGDDLFDHIEDLLDFPSDDVLGTGAVEPCNNQFSSPLLSTLPGDVGDGSLDASDNVGAIVSFGREEQRNLGSCDELDMAQLEWMSNFFDESDSFSFDVPSNCNPVTASMINNDDGKKNSNKDDDNKNNGGTDSDPKFKDDPSSLFRTLSPTSVLENSLSISGGSRSGSGRSFSSSYSSSSSSSSSSSEFYVGAFGNDDFNNAPPSIGSPDCSHDRVLKLRVHARPRSKRSRPAALWVQPQVAASVLPPSFEPPSSVASSDPESFGESCPSPMKKKKKKKMAASTLPLSAAAYGCGVGEEDSDEGSHQAVRKCMHCEITKTPQWRAGPMGPKTLCNACGVRYKSGRLFPEYRPAASPTFVSSIHSNSHKRVVEMRLKSRPSSTGQQKGAGGLLSSCDLLEYIRRT